MIELDVRDAAVEPPDAAWDELVEQLDLPQFWLAAGIAAIARDGHQRVLATRAVVDGSTVGIACYRTGSLTGGRHGRRFLAAGARRVWLCTPPTTFSPGLALAPGMTASERRALRRSIERTTFRAAGRGPHLVGYPSLTAADLEQHGSSRLVVQTAPTAVLDVTWSSLEQYLAGLPGRRRKRFARLLDTVERRDLERLVPGDGSKVDPESFCRLEQQTRRRHAQPGSEPRSLPPAYLKVSSADRAGWFGYRDHHGRLLQADLAFVGQRELLITATAGEDRSRADGLYIAVMLDEVAWAAGNGIDRIGIGPGSVALKRRFGCRLEDQYLAVHPRI